jgi:hypothetical protein
MKKLFLFAVAGMFVFNEQAQAAPYFRLIDPAHPAISAGVYADPTGKDLPSYGSSVALITHSTKDGSLLEAIQTDWSPLTIGGGYGGGQAFMAIGPSANLAPAVKSLAVKALDIVAAGKYENLRQLLSPVPGGGPDINIAFGPALLLRPVEDGHMLAPGLWKGRLRIFAGAAWRF